MNLVKSTTTFSFFTIISRILGYIRDILIAIFLGAGPLADAFFVAFEFPTHLEDYFLKVRLMLLLFQVMPLNLLMEKTHLKSLQQIYLVY